MGARRLGAVLIALGGVVGDPTLLAAQTDDATDYSDTEGASSRNEGTANDKIRQLCVKGVSLLEPQQVERVAADVVAEVYGEEGDLGRILDAGNTSKKICVSLCPTSEPCRVREAFVERKFALALEREYEAADYSLVRVAEAAGDTRSQRYKYQNARGERYWCRRARA